MGVALEIKTLHLENRGTLFNVTDGFVFPFCVTDAYILIPCQTVGFNISILIQVTLF